MGIKLSFIETMREEDAVNLAVPLARVAVDPRAEDSDLHIIQIIQISVK